MPTSTMAGTSAALPQNVKAERRRYNAFQKTVVSHGRPSGKRA
jgi:hypothetical protein